EDPVPVERPDAVRLAADEDEVAGARVHRQARLDRVEEVVAGDELVHRVEAPARAMRAQSRPRRRDGGAPGSPTPPAATPRARRSPPRSRAGAASAPAVPPAKARSDPRRARSSAGGGRAAFP